MAENLYLARLRELAPDIDRALSAEFQDATSVDLPKACLHPLDPFTAHLVLISKLGALFPALAAACLIVLFGPIVAPVSPIAGVIVLLLTACAYVTVSAVARLEAIAGFWKWPRRGEAASMSSLRFMRLHFYPARISSAG